MTRRLQRHVTRAAREVDALGDRAFTPRQLRAIRRNPDIRPMYRGNRIDVKARQLIKNDHYLQHLESNYRRGPDFRNPRTGEWWDMTTEASWPSHVDKYGPNGIRLDTSGR